MSWTDFFIVLACCSVTMLASRAIPLFILKGKEMPSWMSDALGFIPPAAFAALVANDLLSPGMFEGGFWPAAAPLVASLVVLFVGFKTKSLLWCVVAGVGVYALLLVIS